MNIRNLTILAGVSVMTLCTSCDDFLAPKAPDRLSEMVSWESYENAKYYVNGFYGYINDFGLFGGYFGGGMYVDALTDIAKGGSSVPGGSGNANIYSMNPSAITPGQNGLSVWNTAYQNIRRINEFLDGLHKYARFPEAQQILLEGQARFVRAYLYFLLTRNSGSVILIKELTSEKSHPRSSESDCWDFIRDEFDYAIENCPEDWGAADFGRITKGAAYAMKCRAMLYAGRWQEAYDAGMEVKKLADKGMYTLNTNYVDAFKSYSTGNKEALLEFNYKLPLNHYYDRIMAPGGDNLLSGGQVMPTQEIVESYEYKTGGFPDWSNFHTGNDVTIAPPYEQLEPRFHASVLYNGAAWKGRVIETYVDGLDGWVAYPADGGGNKGKSMTSYYVKKYLDETNLDLSNGVSEQTYVEIRYAEVLLNIAEAAYQLKKEDVANQMVAQIRTRVGLPYSNLTGESLINQIRQERKVELAFEGHRYWDLRRWRLAHTVLSGIRVHGFKIQKVGPDYKYTYIECDDNDRQFPQKLYTLPIPPDEIANNVACEQLDAWK